jgi:RNase H-like domain found in reverse transcriptase/Reverse transcriptase (RNA-dependent DNA polymerase)
MKKGDEWKAAFQMNWGLFEPLVTFFGLTNSPSMFQMMMKDIFQDLIMEGIVCVYLDDILIFMKSIKEHQCITWLMLEWHVQRQNLHGSRIPVKVVGVIDWPTLTSKRRYSPFSGSQTSIEDSSKISCTTWNPFLSSQKKSEIGNGGFQSSLIKNQVTSSPILCFADDSKAFHIEADSSDYATGSVLSQQSSDNLKWHPITFYSKSLNAVKQNYEIHDNKMPVVMRSLEEWRHFLKGVKHKVEI